MSTQEILAIGPSLGLKFWRSPSHMSLNVPPLPPGPMLRPAGGWGQVSWVQDLGGQESFVPFPQTPLCPHHFLPTPSPLPTHTHSLFSIKNHKILLDRIKAVLKVVILLLVRMSAGCHQVLSQPLR